MKSSLLNFNGRSMSSTLVRCYTLTLIVFSILLSSFSLKAEDCIRFNPNDIEIVPFGTSGQYRIIAGGNHAMFLFPNYAEARQAYNTIKFYGINQSCYVGRPHPSFRYLLVGNNSPMGKMPGEDCISFNPRNLKVVCIKGSWKIVEGSHWVFDFGKLEGEARESLRIIQKYGFTQSCYIGRPNPSLSYLRKEKTVSSLPNLDGYWVNEDKNTRGITKVTISSNTTSMKAWGSCHPTDCEWGSTSVSNGGTRYVANYDQGFVRRNIFMKMVTVNGVKKLRLLVYSYYRDNRPDRKDVYYFVPVKLQLQPAIITQPFILGKK